MSFTLGKVGRFNRSRFSAGEQTYIEILQERLKDENKGFIRKYIRRKIKQIS
jgi:hypothetical protein